MQSIADESYSTVQRRQMELGDYLDIVRRQKAWILGPAFAGLVIAVVVAFLWPDTYVSTATIRVVPPQVPASLVPSNLNSAMSQRINAMYQSISSRETLTNIINTYNLYPAERNRKPMEDIVEDFRKDIRIGRVGSLALGDRQEVPAFQIQFSYDNRIVAQRVTQELVSRFINENTRERTQQSSITTQFLKEQTEAAQRELNTLEEKLAAFRQSYSGRLPEQLAQNTMQLNMLEQRVANLNSGLSRIAQEKMLLEADLRSLNTQKATLAPTPELAVRKEKNQRLEQLDMDIMRQEAAIASLRQHYKDTYPDVRRAIAMLENTRSLRDRLASRADQEETAANSAAPVRTPDPLFSRESREIEAAIERIQAQLDAKNLEAENHRKGIAETERQIRSVQARIEAAPVSQQQYAELVRDHALAKARYEEMTMKRSQSAVAEELERRQQGETLELLDAASLPQTPTEPKRPMILAAGAAMGLVLGLFLAGAREAKDSSLKNLKDVRAYTHLPILGSIPLLENDLVVRRRRRLAWLAWSTACLVGILIMTGSVFYYYATRV